MQQNMIALEFPVILQKLQEVAVCEAARAQIAELAPSLDEAVCRRRMEETSAARALLDVCGSPPLPSMKGLEELLSLAVSGAMLLPEQLTSLARFIASCRRLAAYLRRGEASGERVAVYGRSFCETGALQGEIEAAVNEDRVEDSASPLLRDLRRRMERCEAQIKEKLAHILQSRKQYLAEGFIARRGGRYVLPVLRQYQSQFGGTVVEVSGKGSTVFMEPTAVRELQEQWDALSIEEDGELRRILYTLTALAAENADALRANMELCVLLDVLFAKAKLSQSQGARAVELSGGRLLRIVQGRHPLLKRSECVPLDFELGGACSGVIITGPNTGGKTVALKTVGLLTLMAQSGLHIPCGEGSIIALQDGCWCDIGDSQNITQNLSTFSGHITNVVDILAHASRDSLVLLDELGSGTDPAEGMGLAISVLEELRRRSCMFLVTTHYPQVKAYAERTEGVLSARMAFDRESLRPLYKLELGKSGESCALYIAERLGLAPSLLRRAYSEVYGEGSAPAALPPAAAMHIPKSRLARTAPPPAPDLAAAKFSMGDSVLLTESGETGIVYRPADERGDVIVQVKGVKRRIRHTRLKLRVAAAELYPPDYDFSIIFDSVENRKARHLMDRRYDPDAQAVYEEGEYLP